MSTFEHPPELASGPVRLRFDRFVHADAEKGLVPFYHFKIIEPGGGVAGHINYRIEENRHIILCAGHLGYEVVPAFRGAAYSLHACRAIVPFARRRFDRLILTVDPSNAPSVRIIEKLGTSFLDEIDVPVDDPAYAGGARRKRRYEWNLTAVMP